MAELVLPGRSSSPSPVISPARQHGGTAPGVCSLCLSEPGKYTCPRCNAPYCSLACYRGPRHTACSELFYQECVLQVLREEAGPSDRRQMEEMLLRLREEEQAGVGECLNGAGVGEALDGAGLWATLSAQEKEDFSRLLQSGDIGALVPEWKPWWHPEEGSHRKIVELSQGAEETSATAVQADRDDHAAVPPTLTFIPLLCTLSRNPSPLVKYTVVNVLYGYTFSMLRHNGDVSDCDLLVHFTGTLLSVSAALTTNAVYNTTAHALKSAVRAASDPHTGDKHLACSAMEATSHILHANHSMTYALAALSHLYRLLGRVRKHLADDKEIRKGAFNAKKKCLFLAAWVKENEECLAVLGAEVMVEYKLYVDELSGVEEISRGLQKVWGGQRPKEVKKKQLIEEVEERTTDHNSEQ